MALVNVFDVVYEDIEHILGYSPISLRAVCARSTDRSFLIFFIDGKRRGENSGNKIIVIRVGGHIADAIALKLAKRNYFVIFFRSAV